MKNYIHWCDLKMNREQLLKNANRYRIDRYEDGRIDKIVVFQGKRQIEATQALYKDIDGKKRISEIQGLLFPEIWNSVENEEKAWFDRNPTTKFESYYATFDNHAVIIHWTYTVPAGRKAIVEVLRAYINKVAANTAFTEAKAMIYYVPSGGAQDILAAAYLFANTIGAQDSYEQGQSLILNAGDSISFRTICTCTAGEARTFMAGYLKATEFDA